MVECRAPPAAGPGHHGALKKAALAEAYCLLAREGPDGATLRAIACQVGVTPNALYRHMLRKAHCWPPWQNRASTN
jgi:AcrR family transcriptional regulator